MYVVFLPCIQIPNSDCLSPSKRSKLNFSKYKYVLIIWNLVFYIFIRDWSISLNKGQNVWQVYCAGLKLIYFQRKEEETELFFPNEKRMLRIPKKKNDLSEVVRPLW